MPLISVLIPAFNSETMIRRAIDSALAQTVQDLEVLVIDDASTDQTASVVASYADREIRVRLHRRTINGGPAASRNTGLQLARGEWIALLDADDLMLPDRLERLLARATSQDVLVADNLEMYDLHAGKVVKLGINPSLLSPEIRLDCVGFVAHCKTNQPDAVDFGLLKPLLRSSHLLRHNITYNEAMRHGEDFRFFLDVLIAGGSLLVLPEAYYRYTERTGSISRKASGVSATRARYDLLELQNRDLARDARYAAVAAELNLRADAFQRLVKLAAFRERSTIAKLASVPAVLVDQEMRGYFVTQIVARAGRMLGRPST